jgi:hypothetical protein
MDKMGRQRCEKGSTAIEKRTGGGYAKNVLSVNTQGLTIHIIMVAVLSLCLVLLAGTNALAEERAFPPDTECLARHKEELTPDCRLRVAEVAARIKEVHQACQEDITRFCAGAKPVVDRGQYCLCAQAGDRFNRDTCICQ